MAINLLNTMKSGCIYKANGCRWKGLVKDLAAHHKECTFAVAQCPYGCGVRVDRHTMRAHQRACEFRPVNDCPCHTTFRFKDREQHQAACLPYLQHRLPEVLAERGAAYEALRALEAQLQDVLVDGAEKRVQAASSTAAALLLSLSLLSILGQMVYALSRLFRVSCLLLHHLLPPPPPPRPPPPSAFSTPLHLTLDRPSRRPSPLPAGST